MLTAAARVKLSKYGSEWQALLSPIVSNLRNDGRVPVLSAVTGKKIAQPAAERAHVFQTLPQLEAIGAHKMFSIADLAILPKTLLQGCMSSNHFPTGKAIAAHMLAPTSDWHPRQIRS